MDQQLHHNPIARLLEAGCSAEEAGDWEAALEIYHEGLHIWDPGTPQAAELLRRVGLIHYYRGDYEVALNLFESSRRVALQVNFRGLEAQALNCLGIVRQALGEIDVAEQHYQHAQLLASDLEDQGLAVMLDQNLAILACIRGENEEALWRYLQVLSRFRTLGDAHGVARVLINIGLVYTDLESWAEAEEAFDQALAASETGADPETLATLHLNRAELYVRMQRFDDARACCDRAFEIFARLESKSGLGEAHRTYGMLYRESGKLYLSETHLALVTELASEADHPLLRGEAEIEFAMTRLAQGRNRDALAGLHRAHRIFTAVQTRRERIHIDRQMQRLEHSYLQVAQAWGEAIESENPARIGHCTRVAEYTCRLAEEVGTSAFDLTRIRAGAYLHDIGSSRGSPDHQTSSSGDPRDWEETRRHAVAGDEIVVALGLPWDIRSLVRSHHERWDGTGYPDQLEAEQIPVAARMLCIADLFDTLTTARSYRRPLTVSDALGFMQSRAGHIVDPTLFSIFRNLIETGALDLRAHLPTDLRVF